MLALGVALGGQLIPIGIGQRIAAASIIVWLLLLVSMSKPLVEKYDI